MVREGSWWVRSKIDPRWNASGRDYVGGFECPSPAYDHIAAKEKELGEPPPPDLMFGYMKD